MSEVICMDNLNPAIIENICNVLSCKKDDIKDFTQMKESLTNTNYKFYVKDNAYIYRDPGLQTEEFLNRECEYFGEQIAKELGINKTLIAMDPAAGWKISKFINGCEYMDPFDPEVQKIQMGIIKILHDKAVVADYEFNFIKKSDWYIETMEKAGIKEADYPEYVEKYDICCENFSETHQRMKELEKKVDSMDGCKKVLCHNDAWYRNFLKAPDGEVTLIDWEYCGNGYPAADVASFAVPPNFTTEQYIALAEVYEGHKLSDVEYRHYIANAALCVWHWYVWGIWKESIGTEIGEELKIWYDKSVGMLELAETLY